MWDFMKKHSHGCDEAHLVVYEVADTDRESIRKVVDEVNDNDEKILESEE